MINLCIVDAHIMYSILLFKNYLHYEIYSCISAAVTLQFPCVGSIKSVLSDMIWCAAVWSIAADEFSDLIPFQQKENIPYKS